MLNWHGSARCAIGNGSVGCELHALGLASLDPHPREQELEVDGVGVRVGEVVS